MDEDGPITGELVKFVKIAGARTFLKGWTTLLVKRTSKFLGEIDDHP
jgi:hypothetical protein